MPKYQVKLLNNGEPELDDEIFDTEEEAEEHALYLCSCDRLGAEIMNMSNPGDYEYDEESYDELEYEIVEIDD